MVQPRDPDYYDRISEIEDLDPEPVRERGFGSRRDLLIGIPLILVVILFVGWQYWRQQYQSEQYHAGQDAIGRSEWETAIRFFAEASGYSDADAQAKGAQEQIDERDRLYKSANDYASKEDWLYALRDIRAAEKIQPNYADLNEMEESAIRNIYTGALGGAIVVRDKADPPGLYYRTNDKWVWLQGSDRRSTPLARDEEGHIVYDVPSDVIQPRPPPMPGSLYNSGDLFIGRKLVWAQASNGEIGFTELSLDASHFVPFTSGKNGLWLVHPVDFIPNDHHNEPIIRDPFHVTEMAYQPYAGGAASTVQIPPSTEIASGETIVSIDPGSNKYLLAEWRDTDSFGVTSSTVVNLYLCAMGETTRRLIYSHTGGGLQSAQLSPDGRFVVVHTYTKLDTPETEEQSTVLVDLVDSNRTAKLVTLTVQRNDASTLLPVMTSAFVRRGILKESLVLALHLPATTHIQLLDPLADPRTVNFLRTDVRIEGRTYKNWEVTGQSNDGILVVGQEANRESVPLTNTLSMVRISPMGDQETHNIEVSPFSGITDAFIEGQGIRWTNYEYITSAEMRRPVRSLFSLAGPNTDQPQRLFTTNGIESGYLLPDPSFRLGDELLAYSNGNELHARTYDGQLDTVLERGVATIFEDTHGSFYTDHMK